MLAKIKKTNAVLVLENCKISSSEAFLENSVNMRSNWRKK